MQLWTYDGETPSSPFHESIVNWLHDTQDLLFLHFVYFPSSNVDCDGVFGSSSSSSTKVPSFYSTNAS
jgi:hypothetical protein